MINIHFTNGAGNNIFQYVYARLLAEEINTELVHPELSVLSIYENKKLLPNNPKKIIGSSKNPVDYHSLFGQDNLDLKVYPEDFTLYTHKIDEIKEWFSKVEKTNTDDLVFHLRLGDRLVMNSTYKPENYISPAGFKDAIDSFEFDRLHIVTDMPVWKEITEEDVKNFVFHRRVKDKDRCPLSTSVKYFNNLYKMLEEYKPIVRVGNSVQSDFDYIRGFDKILFQHGTLSWWAAALSDASEVAVYGRWRGNKNINLGWTDLPGWRQWGQKTAPNRQIKEWHLTKIAKENNLKVFVETGTKGGTTLKNLKNNFKEMHSVEIIEKSYKRVNSQIKDKHIHLYLGDSAKVLPEILKKIKEPTLFWLDAHDNRNSTPILKELDSILPAKGHVILIDDLRYFGTEEAYPTTEEIEALVYSKQPDAKIDYKFDSVRIWT